MYSGLNKKTCNTPLLTIPYRMELVYTVHCTFVYTLQSKDKAIVFTLHVLPLFLEWLSIRISDLI